MAILHQAQLNPTKLELLQTYIPGASGFDVADGSDLTLIGAYRFDDPDGEVGIESHLLSTSDGRTIHVPLTYRSAPLEGAQEWLVGTLEHSVLGTRWTYHGCGDPVYVRELVRTVVEGDTQVKLEVLTEDGLIERENNVFVQGSGATGVEVSEAVYRSAQRSGADVVVDAGAMAVVTHNILTSRRAPADACLAGTWPGSGGPITIATVTAT